MKIKLTIKNAVMQQKGDIIEIISQGSRQAIDVEVTQAKFGQAEERRIYVHDKEEQTKIWMC